MAFLSVLFSLDELTVTHLKAFASDEEQLEYLQEEIEEKMMAADGQRYAELDKSWDAMHRALTDGALAWDNGSFPLNHVILGGDRIYAPLDYIMTLKTPGQVIQIAEALPKVSWEAFEKGYYAIDPKDYGFELTAEDLDYTWTWFQDSLPFWTKAAAEQRYVLFTADQ